MKGKQRRARGREEWKEEGRDIGGRLRVNSALVATNEPQPRKREDEIDEEIEGERLEDSAF